MENFKRLVETFLKLQMYEILAKLKNLRPKIFKLFDDMCVKNILGWFW